MSAFHPECLIIANGSPLPLALLKRLAPSKFIVALDGAVNALNTVYHREIAPDVVLGDFDSTTEETRRVFSESKVFHTPSQDFTDLEKGIQFCDQKKAPAIWIVNALGLNRMDHTLANLNFLKKYSAKGRPLKLVSLNDVVEFVKDRELKFPARLKEPVGVFGFPSARVTSTGLEYPMERYLVSVGESLSSSNYVSASEVTLVIAGDALVSYPHPFSL